MDKRNLAFTRINYILLVVGMAIVVLGFLLMSGSGSTDKPTIPIFSVPVASKWLQWFASLVLYQ